MYMAFLLEILFFQNRIQVSLPRLLTSQYFLTNYQPSHEKSLQTLPVLSLYSQARQRASQNGREVLLSRRPL
jgi:hypothetical protein